MGMQVEVSRLKDDADNLTEIIKMLAIPYGIQIVHLILSNAQVKSTPTANPPVLLIAPGLGKRIVPLFASLTSDFRGGIYTGLDATNEVNITVGNQRATTKDNIHWLLELANARYVVDLLPRANVVSNLVVANEGFDPSEVENSSMTLRIENSGVALTGGNDSNVLYVNVVYCIL